MKKALALVLALVLALSMGVVAFADVLELVELKPVPEAGVDKIYVSNTLLEDTVVANNGRTYLAPAVGGDFYFAVKNFANLKDVKVEASGAVSAELVKFDGATMEMDGVVFLVYDTEAKRTLSGAEMDAYLAAAGVSCSVVGGTADWSVYENAAALAKAMNNADKLTSKYVVKVYEATDFAKEVEVNLLKVTVEPNYSASYKTGSFKLTATDKTTKKAVAYSGKIISDVTIFEYEMVKWAGSYGEALKVNDEGYSLYKFDGVYSKNGGDYNYSELRERGSHATVLSTTEFRVLRENKQGIKVAAGDMLVEIPEVAASQKGVNFAYYGVKYNTVKNAVQFGFYGDQVIASDFSITLTIKNAYQLREFFGENVEEEDIITYYVVKDGKVADSFTVDYMKDDIVTNLELVIKGKAGDTLGQYEIVLEAPAAPEAPAEENPNTGAESVIGVVAAMAVVSVAAAAAVSLKK